MNEIIEERLFSANTLSQLLVNQEEEENHLSVNIEEIVENLSDDEDDDFLGEKIAAENRYIQQVSFDRSLLPATVTVLTGNNGETVYMVGTAHFSEESCLDVEKVISMVQPDFVLIELCKARTGVLAMSNHYNKDDDKLTSMERLKRCIDMKGVAGGLILYLLDEATHNVTNQIGMQPGGDMRAAHQAALKVPGCKLFLGDRPFEVTMKRMMSRLSFWAKLKFGWKLSRDIFSKISSEDIEKLKDNDIIEAMYKEIVAEFPELADVLVKERDLFITAFIRRAIDNKIEMPEGFRAPVMVAVVGMGHTRGIQNLFYKDMDPYKELKSLLELPPARKGSLFKYFVRSLLLSLTTYAAYRLLRRFDVFSKLSAINFPQFS